ncbi:uncharacterized protein PV09_06626 [Verruconis gallopava]|uniref:RING-type domain-containing protein n=1 Tax=Verruconis gallopava TaxID=253628 RepID=A0A0D2A6E2_9PEZI|nr:uncharacterized protein PV09_06626 [Verruconis gallopava]KIW02140.1 hypothetical protein PV09_06626 [Verruconis gallopava]
MAEGAVATASSPAIDLGEDLNCAICMQILYQPLTLLDCMHTFCGACLKDWFAHQAASARSIHPYTCPSCRDSVRTTKRYPLIMNWLEKHLSKNPDKARSEEDKREHEEKYKPGDNVLPKLRLRHPPPDEEDNRLMEEVMQMSLREAGITESSTQANTLQPTDSRRPGLGHVGGGSRSRNGSRSPGRRSTERSREAERNEADLPSPTQRETSTRQVEHQSSLISLLSVSEMSPEEMQQEITRMIADEGLLDDVDLSNLDATREEELSERIAAAYRRRKEDARRRRREADAARDRSRHQDRNTQRAPSSRTSSRPGTEENGTRATDRRRTGDARPPPISNPQLIDSANQGQARHRRSGSSGNSRATARMDSGVASLPSPTLAPILPVVSTSEESRRRQSNERSATDPNRAPTGSHVSQQASPGSAPATPRNAEMSHASFRTHVRQRSDSNPQHSPRLGSSNTFPRTSHNHSTSSLPIGLNHSATDPFGISSSGSGTLNLPSSAGRPSSSSSTSAHSRPVLHTEPSISCSKCAKEHIEFEVHYNCPKCSTESQPYNICKSCFRHGMDNCQGWLGFGSAAMRVYESRMHSKTQPPSSLEKPHVFTAQRYVRPKHPLVPSPTSDRPHRQLTYEDPAKRLEKGVFCDQCSAFANNCYWKCDACNDGEWGFCNDCVNQGKHCTHPLLPLKARESEYTSISQVDGHLSAPTRPDAEQHPSPPLTPKSASIIDGPVVIPVANIPFQPLTFHTLCDLCTNPIPPSVTRFHCPQCNGGDYDICMSCYHGLVATGKISSVNGPQGWRRCPQNHRMVVIGFQDAGGGQRRVVARDLVGGWTFFEEPQGSNNAVNTTSVGTRKWRWTGDNGQEQEADPEYRTRLAGHVRIPPDGGIGLVFYARWNYFPENATDKDLCFPKGAEIREAEDINGDWLWGVYAGKTGLFFAPYVNFLRKVTV